MCSSLREKTSAKYLSKIPRGPRGPNGAAAKFFEKPESMACDEQQKHGVTSRRVLQNERNV